jgi:sigma-B regulation protein RsbU (phosphoserine phosphatase)
MVLITDGVTEAQDTEGRMFGLDGALASFARRDANGPAAPSPDAPSPDAIVANLVEAVRAFEHPTEPSDDLTILALCYRGADA